MPRAGHDTFTFWQHLLSSTSLHKLLCVIHHLSPIVVLYACTSSFVTVTLVVCDAHYGFIQLNHVRESIPRNILRVNFRHWIFVDRRQEQLLMILGADFSISHFYTYVYRFQIFGTARFDSLYPPYATDLYIASSLGTLRHTKVKLDQVYIMQPKMKEFVFHLLLLLQSIVFVVTLQRSSKMMRRCTDQLLY